jgi:hypothetical protein
LFALGIVRNTLELSRWESIAFRERLDEPWARANFDKGTNLQNIPPCHHGWRVLSRGCPVASGCPTYRSAWQFELARSKASFHEAAASKKAAVPFAVRSPQRASRRFLYFRNGAGNALQRRVIALQSYAKVCLREVKPFRCFCNSNRYRHYLCSIWHRLAALRRQPVISQYLQIFCFRWLLPPRSGRRRASCCSWPS